MPLVYIGLGTNLGDKPANVARVYDFFTSNKEIRIIKKSSVEVTEPVDFLEQPSFLNQVILIETKISPVDLMIFLQAIEKEMGRKKIVPKGPRIIDLDILLYNDIILDIYKLKIPHPEIKNRKFILKHLLEIDPELVDPVTGHMYRDFY